MCVTVNSRQSTEVKTVAASNAGRHPNLVNYIHTNLVKYMHTSLVNYIHSKLHDATETSDLHSHTVQYMYFTQLNNTQWLLTLRSCSDAK